MSEKLREAARQALEAWDDLQSFQKPTTLHQRIEALRAALAEPEPVQEPVAWMYTGIKSMNRKKGRANGVFLDGHLESLKSAPTNIFDVTKVYPAN